MTADGLIVAKAVGSVTLSVINNGLQHDIALIVQQAILGNATVQDDTGAIATDADGNLLMVAPGALPAGTTVSISSLALTNLGMPLPAPEQLDALGAVQISTGGVKADLPLQLAVKVSGPVDPVTGVAETLAAGTQVYFWRKGTIKDIDGTTKDTWWLVDNGVIGDDGIARTSSPPYDGVLGAGGAFVVTKSKVADENTGEIRVAAAVVNTDALWAQAAFIALAPSPAMAISAIGLFASVAAPVYSMGYTLAGSYKTVVPQGALDPEIITKTFPAPPTLSVYTPTITSLDFNPQTRKLKITGTNFVPPNSFASDFDLRVWLAPRGEQITLPTDTGVAPDRGLIWQGFYPEVTSFDTSLEITVPDGVALSMHVVYVERIARGSSAEDATFADFPVDSDPIEAWTLGTSKTLITTAHSIDVFATTADMKLGLVSRVMVDEHGQELNLYGRYGEQIAFSNDGTLAFIAGRNGNIYVFDTQTLRVEHTLHVEGSSTGLTSLAVVDGWLYVTEGNSYGATGGRLVRVNIDQLSIEFLRSQQLIDLGVDAPLGFLDMAVNNGSYLALTAPLAPATVAGYSDRTQGNVYVIDLGKIDKFGRAPDVVTIDSSVFPSSKGRVPQYISSGEGDGEFLLSSAKDRNSGIISISLDLDARGSLAGSADLSTTRLTPAESDPLWSTKKFQQNIQRAAGNVVVEYEGKEYAIVADYNFIFNDPHFTAEEGYAIGKQIGGKLGIIEDPFGKQGGPKFLGATTPIVGGAVDHLTLGQDGRLYADVFIEDVTSPTSEMYKSLFVWDASNLIREALGAQMPERGPLSNPIDRIPKVDGQIPDVTPDRYNGQVAGQKFGWIYGVGTYTVPGRFPKLKEAPPNYRINASGGDATIGVEDNIYTRALGITDKEVQEAIERGKTGALSAAWYAAKVALYDGWNFFTAGFVGRQAARVEAVDNGQSTDGSYLTATLIDSVASVASIAVAGRVGAGGAAGLWGEVAAGAKAGAAFTIIQKTGEIGTYVATGGDIGDDPLTAEYARNTITELATSTVAGSGFSFIGSALSRVPKGNYKIVWNNPTVSNPALFRLVEPTIAATDSVLLGSLADTTGGSILRNAGGVLTTPSGLIVELPAIRSFTTQESIMWLAKQSELIPNMINRNASLREQAFEAVALENAFIVASRNAMQNTSAAAQLGFTRAPRTFDEYIRANADDYAGDALYRKVIDDAINDGSELRPVSGKNGCFVAGTLVHTKEGLVPIERIKVGDWVLSQPEKTGDRTYKRVVETFVYDDKEVYSVDFATKDKIGTLVVTGNHPFFVPGLGWTRADALDARHSVELADGRVCSIFNVSPVFRTAVEDIGWIQGGFGTGDSDDPWGRQIDLRNDSVHVVYEYEARVENADIDLSRENLLKRRVYNFEVEEYHTYYVGELGVWVHNQNCADESLAKAEAAVGVIPGPNTRVYTAPEARTLTKYTTQNKGIILVEETTAGMSDEAIAFQRGTEGVQTAPNGNPAAWTYRYNNPNQSANAQNFTKAGDGRAKMPDGTWSLTTIDAKLSFGRLYDDTLPDVVTQGTRKSAGDTFARIRNALDQNPAYSHIIEFKPPAADATGPSALDDAIRLVKEEVYNRIGGMERIMLRNRGDDTVELTRLSQTPG